MEMSQLTYDILAYATGFFVYIPFLVFICLVAVWLIVSLVKTEQNRREYIKSLDEHDKTVISNYLSQNTYLFFDKKRKEDNKD